MGRVGKRATQGKAEPPPFATFFVPSAGSCVLRLGAGGHILGRLPRYVVTRGTGGLGDLDLLVDMFNRAARVSASPYASGRHTVR